MDSTVLAIGAGIIIFLVGLAINHAWQSRPSAVRERERAQALAEAEAAERAVAMAQFHALATAAVADAHGQKRHLPLGSHRLEQFTATVREAAKHVADPADVSVTLDLEGGEEAARGIRRNGCALQKTEYLRYAHLEPVEYYEQKKRVRYRNRNAGMSFRVAKGVSVRTGGSRGERQESYETVKEDIGHLVLTTRHLYFHGERRQFRIRLDKVVATLSYQNGLGLTKEGVTAREQVFVTGDDWAPLLIDVIGEAMP